MKELWTKSRAKLPENVLATPAHRLFSLMVGRVVGIQFRESA